MLHSPFGASQAERIVKCPGSYWLAKRANALKLDNEDEYNVEGTAAHTIAERKLKTFVAELRGEERAFSHSIGLLAGNKLKLDSGTEFEITPDVLNAVDVYVDLVKKLVKDYGVDPDNIYLEQKVSIGTDSGELWGTADTIIVVPGYKLIVIDYKNGAGVNVAVEDNYQLKYYALGALESIPASLLEDLDYVDTYIVQPNAAYMNDGKAIRTATYNTAHIFDYKKTLMEAEENIQLVKEAPHKHLNPGYKQCRFCPARHDCPALTQMIESRIGCKVAEIGDVDADELETERIARFLDIKEMVYAKFKAISTRAYRMAQAGHDIPGYELEDTFGDRSWKDSNEVIRRYTPIVGDELWKRPEPKLLSPNQLAELLKQKGKFIDKESPLYDLMSQRFGKDHELVFVPTTGKALVKSKNGTTKAPKASGHPDFKSFNKHNTDNI